MDTLPQGFFKVFNLHEIMKFMSKAIRTMHLISVLTHSRQTRKVITQEHQYIVYISYLYIKCLLY